MLDWFSPYYIFISFKCHYPYLIKINTTSWIDMANYLKIKIEKMITSEHVLVHVLVVWWKRHVPFFEYLNFHISVHSMNFESCYTMMTADTQGRVHFWILPLHYKTFGHKTPVTNRYSHDKYFQGFLFCMIWKTSNI